MSESLPDSDPSVYAPAARRFEPAEPTSKRLAPRAHEARSCTESRAAIAANRNQDFANASDVVSLSRQGSSECTDSSRAARPLTRSARQRCILLSTGSLASRRESSSSVRSVSQSPENTTWSDIQISQFM